MDTPVQQPGGMPPITPSGDPQPAVAEPNVSAVSGAGASFVGALLDQMAQPSQPVVPPTSPVVPQVVQPPQVQPPQVQPPQVQPPQVQQPPVPPAPIDYGNRYSTTPPEPTLQPLPDLPPEQPVVAPQNLNEQQNHAWAGMRAQMNANRRLAEEYRNKYNQVIESTKKYGEEKTAFTEQLNQKDSRIKELEDEIGRIDLSKSPEFQEKYDAPLNDVRNNIAQTLIANGLNQGDASQLAENILLADAKDVPSMISELPTHAQGLIMVAAEQGDKLWGARAAALENWKQSADGLAAVASRGSAIINAQRTAMLADEAIRLVKSMPVDKGLAPAFQVSGDEDAAFVADRDAKEQQFRSWVQQAPEEQKMAAMFEGFMAPKTYEMLQQTWLENQQLKQMVYNRGRMASPPIAPVYNMPPPPPPPPPPQAPTVAANGYSQANLGVDAAGFTENLINAMFSPQPKNI